MNLPPYEFNNGIYENDNLIENLERNENTEDPIYIMTLELEHEKFEQIKIYSNSDPDQLAYIFCKEHNLDFSAMEYLKEKIDDLIKKSKNKDDDSQIEEVESEFNVSESNNSTFKNSKKNSNKIIENNNHIKSNNDNQNLNNFNKNEEITLNDNNLFFENNNNYEKDNIENNDTEKNNINENNENSFENKEEKIEEDIHKRINNLIQTFHNQIPKAKDILEYEKLNDNNNVKNSFNYNQNLKKILNSNFNNNKEENLKISDSEDKIDVNQSNRIKRNLSDSSSIKGNLYNKYPLNNLKGNYKNISRELEIKRLIPHEKILSPNKNENDISTQISQTNNFYKNLSSSLQRSDNNINNHKKFIENGNNILPSSYRKQLSQSKFERIKKEYQDKYPFQPKINDNYKTDLNFNERQQFFTRLYKQKLINNINNFNNKEKKLFTPKLLSKKINHFNHSNVDVYTKNYLYAVKYKRNKDDLFRKYYNFENKPIQLGKESEKILQKKNDEIFSLIFKELDSDQDNYISPHLINLNNTPKEVLKIIDPLINELIEDKQTLDENDFIQAMNKLYYNISNEDKYLINDIYRKKRGLSTRIYYCKVNHNLKKNIKPIINNKSRKLASIHDKKIERKLKDCLKSANKHNYGQLYLDKKNQIKTLTQNKSEFFQINKKKILNNNNNNNHFSKICNYTFDNYVKNLN